MTGRQEDRSNRQQGVVVELRDTGLGTGGIGRPGEVKVVGKIIQKIRECEKGMRKLPGASTEPKSRILQRQSRKRGCRKKKG